MANPRTRTKTKSSPAAKRPSKRAAPAPRAETAPAKQAASTKRKSAPAKPTASTTKQSQLIELLRSPKGGTIAQMVTLTGWQSHTVRGTISGVLRKRLGLTVQSAVNADSGERVYRIAPAA